jgi:DNA-binding NtrC family response regulator
MARVLLVDEDRGQVAQLEAALTTEGHTVLAVSTPDECMASIRRFEPDVVVTDAVFQGAVRGFDLVRFLAADLPQVPLIMATSADDLLDASQLAEQDHDGWLPALRYLQKPVALEALLYEVEHALPTTH